MKYLVLSMLLFGCIENSFTGVIESTSYHGREFEVHSNLGSHTALCDEDINFCRSIYYGDCVEGWCDDDVCWITDKVKCERDEW